MRALLILVLSCGLLAFASVDPAHAQASRTWVSGVGDDANPCSRTAPCKTFAGAISKTAAHGEISVLDPGGFGALTITKSISIVSEGSEGSVSACLVNGFIINAAPTDVVSIHGVFFEGCNTGLAGIKIISAKAVHIQNCKVRGFTSTSSTTNGGISVVPTAANVKVVITNCNISKNRNGVVVVPTGAGQATVMIDRSVIDDHPGFGVRSSSGATVHLTNSVITGNNIGLGVSGGGTLVSSGNNVIVNNDTNGAPTSTVPLQ